MATYKILTNDLWVNAEGKHECFLQIEINDGTEVWNKAARIHATDVALVVADPDNIDVVAQAMMEKAILSRPQEKADEEYQKQVALAKIQAGFNPDTGVNVKQFFGRLIQEISSERWFSLSKLAIGWTMEQLINYPNFPGLKLYIAGLVADQTLTAEDAEKINLCLLEQQIDLSTF